MAASLVYRIQLSPSDAASAPAAQAFAQNLFASNVHVAAMLLRSALHRFCMPWAAVAAMVVETVEARDDGVVTVAHLRCVEGAVRGTIIAACATQKQLQRVDVVYDAEAASAILWQARGERVVSAVARLAHRLAASVGAGNYAQLTKEDAAAVYNAALDVLGVGGTPAEANAEAWDCWVARAAARTDRATRTNTDVIRAFRRFSQQQRHELERPR